jgi:hypothetical protein
MSTPLPGTLIALVRQAFVMGMTLPDTKITL